MTPTQPRPAAGTWELSADPAEFERAAGAYLRADRALHTVQLSVTAALLAGEPRYTGVRPRFGVWRDGDGRVAGSFLCTPPFPPVVSPLGPDAARELAAVLDGDGPGGDGPDGDGLRGVNGPVEGARAVAAWLRRHPGGTVEESMAQRLYRLDRLTPPDPAPAGRARVAGAADRARVAGWIKDFADEGHGGPPGGFTEEQALAWTDSRLPGGGVTLWEAADGTPVSMASVTPPGAGCVRVASVFTPKERRGRGYAGAVTAEVSRVAVERGADEVVLFTDLANGTSNALYQRLGYRPVRDFTVLAFAPRVTATAAP
ncbi:GNAT family N-acetyltransferase [Streptomyces sp. HUAS MG91]|uniref:GNAT family N-acetyltransferase n=1 Tax=Streptomyces tabacisoli TaxID=3156398 RepID=A0AAU8IUZ9_9ACTN